MAKQIDYWNIGSDEDMSAAYALFEKEKYRHALFFAHLAVKKQLKAHVTLRTRAMPPKIHNLSRLAELTALSLQPNRWHGCEPSTCTNLKVAIRTWGR